MFYVFSYPNCNLQKKYPGLRLPTLIDIAGFPDEDEEKYEEILRVVLYGRLPQGASFPEVFEYCKKHGVEGVKNRYAEKEESLKVDRIIFVGSATGNIPKNLVSCLLKAARPTGAMNNPQLRCKSVIMRC